jgi:hypothetical protein
MIYVVDLVDSVEKLFDEKPDKRKKIEYKDWKDKLNSIIQQLNKTCKFKMYEVIR